MEYFTVYFELFGKKMKTTVLAENREKAMEKVKNKIVFHKVEPMPSPDNGVFNHLMDIVNGKK